MFPMLFRLMWMRTRGGLAIAAVVGFAVPLVMIAGGGGLAVEGAPVDLWLRQAELVGQILPVATVFLGVYVGIMAWADDHAGQHVYALSLPVRREVLAIHRFASGSILLLLPAASLLLGSLIATAAIDLPGGVRAYPIALVGRFVLAAFTCYAIFFAVSIATRRAVFFVLATIGAVLLGELLLLLAGSSFDLVKTVVTGLTTWPGPFEVLTGRWALFDV